MLLPIYFSNFRFKLKLKLKLKLKQTYDRQLNERLK